MPERRVPPSPRWIYSDDERFELKECSEEFHGYVEDPSRPLTEEQSGVVDNMAGELLDQLH